MLTLILVSDGEVKAVETNNALCEYNIVKVDTISKRRRRVFEKSLQHDEDTVDIIIGKDGIVSEIKSNYDDTYVIIYNSKYGENSELKTITYASFPETQLNILEEYFDSICMACRISETLCGVCDHEHCSIGGEDPVLTRLLGIEADFLKASTGCMLMKKEHQIELLDSVVECLVELGSDSVSLIEELKSKIQDEYNA